jgi:hypothetical protein
LTFTQQELAKFGYKSKRRVKKFKNPTIFGDGFETYCVNLENSNKIPLLIWGHFGAFFSHKNPLYEPHWFFYIYIFCQVAKICQEKKQFPEYCKILFKCSEKINWIFPLTFISMNDFFWVWGCMLSMKSNYFYFGIKYHFLIINHF